MKMTICIICNVQLYESVKSQYDIGYICITLLYFPFYWKLDLNVLYAYHSSELAYLSLCSFEPLLVLIGAYPTYVKCVI